MEKEQKGFRFFWLKLEKNFFGDAKIKKIRRLPGGDTLAIIYLELMLLSIENDGVLIYEGLEETFEAELALKIEEDEGSILIVLNFLKQYGLLVEINNKSALHLTQNNWSIGSETQANRTRRERKQQFANNLQTICLQSADSLQASLKEKEKDQKKKKKELDKDIEIEIEKEIDTTTAHTREDDVDNSLEYQYVEAGEGALKGGAMLFISKAQISSLFEKYDEKTLGYYLKKITELHMQGYKHGCCDYEYIIKLIEEDRQVKK